MKKFTTLFLGLFLLFLTVPSHAITQAGARNAEFAVNHGGGLQKYQIGTLIARDKIWDLVVQYDFAKSGGAISTITLPYPSSAGGPGAVSAKLPKGAVVIGCYIDVITALTTSASGTMALSTGQAANDLKAALAAASYTGIVACVPVGTAATAIKLTADSTPNAVIATGAITAGKFNLHIQYVLSEY